MRALLSPRSNTELPVAAFIARGKAAAHTLLRNFEKKADDLKRRIKETENDNVQSAASLDALLEKGETDESPEVNKWMEAITNGNEKFYELTKKRKALFSKFLDGMEAADKRTSQPNPVVEIGVPDDLNPTLTMTKNEIGTCRAALDEFTRLFGPYPKVTAITRKEKGRGYYSVKGINLGDTSRSMSQLKTMVFHEIGHGMDYLTADACWKFVTFRRTANEPKPLRALAPNNSYEEDEFALPGTFISPYVGKTYHRNQDASCLNKRPSHTEVFSMGVQQFATPESLQRFFDQDPDHFYLILGCLPHLNPDQPTPAEQRQYSAEVLNA